MLPGAARRTSAGIAFAIDQNAEASECAQSCSARIPANTHSRARISLAKGQRDLRNLCRQVRPHRCDHRGADRSVGGACRPLFMSGGV